jgi:hypothetical protein
VSELTAAPRQCPNCGLEERRGKDDRGHPTLNLDPTTGNCLECLIALARETRSFQSPRVLDGGPFFDARQRAAGTDGE